LSTVAWREAQIMFAVELTFESNARGTRDGKTEAITWLTAALVRNGNLLKEFILVSKSNGWTGLRGRTGAGRIP
jgi:hypothetical protein